MNPEYQKIIIQQLLAMVAALLLAPGSELVKNEFVRKPVAVLFYDVAHDSRHTVGGHPMMFYALRVVNAGTKEAEDLICQISFGNADLDTVFVRGLPASACSLRQERAGAEVRIAYFNAGETLTLDAVLHPIGIGRSIPPTISIRSKGVVGVPVPIHMLEGRISWFRRISWFPVVLGIVLTSLISVIAFIRLWRRREAKSLEVYPELSQIVVDNDNLRRELAEARVRLSALPNSSKRTRR